MNGAPAPPVGHHSPDEPVNLIGFGPTDLYQRREKIFTRYVGGFFQRLRFYTGWPLLVSYFATPWLTWGDRQAVLFDLPARQFHLLGLTIWPQDFWLLGWILMIAAFGLFTVTTVVGRLWCGYTCPQTVWTSIFMWMEQVAEGPRHARMRLEQSPWSLRKTGKRVLKHGMWLFWALFTGATFVGYFTPIRDLVPDLATLNASFTLVFWVLFFTGATYVNAGWMREQVCLYMCPYARFQSAMIDKDTLIVSYDSARGEPRGSRKRGTTSSTLGDCTDCQLCVQVCPTGIDIRNGLQYECIGCAHCVDACAQVMDKMSYAPGLIRYTTASALSGGKIRILRGKSIGYAAVCTVLVAAFAIALVKRTPIEIDILRPRDALFQALADGSYRNDYQLVIANKTQQDTRYRLQLIGPGSLRLDAPATIDVAAGQVENIPFSVAGIANAGNTTIIIKACTEDGIACNAEETRFLAPMGRPS